MPPSLRFALDTTTGFDRFCDLPTRSTGRAAAPSRAARRLNVMCLMSVLLSPRTVRRPLHESHDVETGGRKNKHYYTIAKQPDEVGREPCSLCAGFSR